MSENKMNYYNESEEVNQLISEVMESAQTSEFSEAVYKQTKQLVGAAVEYKELMMMYTCAIKEVRTKFEVLNTEFNVRYQRNPIQFISSRLKRTSSIVEKLEKKGFPFP